MKFLILSLFFSINLEATFGYVGANTYNIGDDFQTIAARQFLPANSQLIEREFLSVYPGDPIHAIINGWFVYGKDYHWYLEEAPPETCWPPAPSIHPLVISFHVTKNMYPTVFNEEGLEWFKKHEPIGARDIDMMEELKSRGIDAYFSACLTLTLPKGDNAREDVIYAVDVDDKIYQYIASTTKTPVVRLTHDVDEWTRHHPKVREKMAERLLENYRHAKAVVTTRLHAFLPCLAFETPVLLVRVENDQYRYDGLRELGRYCTKECLLSGCASFDWENPTPNPRLFVHFRDELVKKVKDWVEVHK